MKNIREKIKELQKKEIFFFIEENKKGLFEFQESFKINIFEDKELFNQYLDIFSMLENDLDDLVKELKLQKKENKKLEHHMLLYKNRLEKISKTKSYKLYQKFKKFLKDK
ncbi:hypothetical protein KAU33_12350 [Candidatus Dependentiae bacterium]|nr:hypothetical protein [Candidatus Dependentiae bacterium]